MKPSVKFPVLLAAVLMAVSVSNRSFAQPQPEPTPTPSPTAEVKADEPKKEEPKSEEELAKEACPDCEIKKQEEEAKKEEQAKAEEAKKAETPVAVSEPLPELKPMKLEEPTFPSNDYFKLKAGAGVGISNTLGLSGQVGLGANFKFKIGGVNKKVVTMTTETTTDTPSYNKELCETAGIQCDKEAKVTKVTKLDESTSNAENYVDGNFDAGLGIHASGLPAHLSVDGAFSHDWLPGGNFRVGLGGGANYGEFHNPVGPQYGNLSFTGHMNMGAADESVLTRTRFGIGESHTASLHGFGTQLTFDLLIKLGQLTGADCSEAKDCLKLIASFDWMRNYGYDINIFKGTIGTHVPISSGVIDTAFEGNAFITGMEGTGVVVDERSAIKPVDVGAIGSFVVTGDIAGLISGAKKKTEKAQKAE